MGMIKDNKRKAFNSGSIAGFYQVLLDSSIPNILLVFIEANAFSVLCYQHMFNKKKTGLA